MKRSVHLIVSGRVQGVFYRASTREVAHRLRLTGYAKNLPDGTVEIEAEGEEAALQQLVSWAHDGPMGAHVDGVDVEWGEFQGDFTGFDRR